MKLFVVLFAIVATTVATKVSQEYLPPLPSNDYLPPVQQSVVAAAPTQEYLPPVSAVAPQQPETVLADDGYRYKTVRRLRYRHRRDVNELPSNEYLPPVQQSVVAAAPTQEYLPPVSAIAPQQPETVLADDGYRYKTVRRLRYRHRRDVNELPSNEYLPPVQQSVSVAAPTQEYLPPVSAVAPQPETVLADDGYRYKTVRRLRYRHRRDVNELPSNEYLPPVQQSVSFAAPTQEYLPPVSAVAPQQPETVLADDGYRYKTVRRLRYRHRRDVNELPSNEYLPPVQQSVVAAAPTQEYLPPVIAVAPQPETVLADDGYRYKTVRRLRYRHRRDVNELPSNEYLPPVQQSVVAAAPTQEYLPPVSAVAPQPETVLADDGYRYKTVRRLRYRHRRDVNELPLNEYLPPVQQTVVAAAPTQEYLPPVSSFVQPQAETVLADDGYRYKTVRKLKYRRH